MNTINLSETVAHEVRGQTVWYDTGASESLLRIPKSQKVTLHKRAQTATVSIGTFGKISLVITGPKATILELFESLTGPRTN